MLSILNFINIKKITSSSSRPHSGDDSITNILCLCPNHHVMLDKGGISISNEFKIIAAENGSLNVDTKHKINLENFSYHRMIHGYD